MARKGQRHPAFYTLLGKCGPSHVATDLKGPLNESQGDQEMTLSEAAFRTPPRRPAARPEVGFLSALQRHVFHKARLP